jgi:hypothetical protein
MGGDKTFWFSVYELAVLQARQILRVYGNRSIRKLKYWDIQPKGLREGKVVLTLPWIVI